MIHQNNDSMNGQNNRFGGWIKIFPFLGWLENYTLKSFRADFISGITVGLVLIPQSMANAQLAGLPSWYGLYAAFLPPVVASLFGSSRHLSTGPVAIVSIMTAAALEPLATSGSEGFIGYAIILSLLIGLFQLSLGLLRLGIVVNFLSHPVINGFTNAAALIIASSQLARLFGIDVNKAEHHYQTIYRVLQSALSYIHWPSLVLALVAFVIIIVIKKITPRIPGILVAVAITTVASWALEFEHNRKAVIDDVGSTVVSHNIELFNKNLSRLSSALVRKVELGDQYRTAVDQYGLHSVEAIRIHADLELLEVEITELRKLINRHRTDLRSYIFVSTKEMGRTVYFTENDLPESHPDGGKRWRLRVGNQPLDDVDSLTFLGGGAVVGQIPAGLPSFEIPGMSIGGMNLRNIFTLIPIAIVIALVGFMEAISIARTIAAKAGQRVDTNQELIGQGLANICGSFTQGYAVSGSFARSAINFQSGATCGFSNIIASSLVVVVLLFLTPLLYHLPQSVLAAIIMTAVIGLINIRGVVNIWKAQWYDGVIAVVTFIATLVFAPHLEWGILTGVALSVGSYLYRSMMPTISFLSKHRDGSFRDQRRFELEQCRHIALIRFHGSLFFGNSDFLKEKILRLPHKIPELKYVVIIGVGISELDSSGAQMLAETVTKMRREGYEMSFANMSDAVIDVMKRTGLYDLIDEHHIFGTAHGAIEQAWHTAHADSNEKLCPLIIAPLKKLRVTDKIKRDPRFIRQLPTTDGSLPEE